jgi:hypothetical protein
MAWLASGMNNQTDVLLEIAKYRKNRLLVSDVCEVMAISRKRPLQFGALPGR